MVVRGILMLVLPGPMSSQQEALLFQLWVRICKYSSFRSSRELVYQVLGTTQTLEVKPDKQNGIKMLQDL